MFTASMKFDLGEDVDAMREMVHRWAQERVKPMAADIDRQNEFPAERFNVSRKRTKRLVQPPFRSAADLAKL